MIDVYILDDDYTPIHLNQNENIRLTSISQSNKINEIGSLNITFPKGNNRSALLHPKKTKISVVDHVSKAIIFRGRVYENSISSDNTFSVESSEAYLNDSITPFIENFKGKPSQLLKRLIDEHNKQAVDSTKFVVGECGIDMYKYYPESDEITTTNAGQSVNGSNLSEGQTITVKPNARYIYSVAGGTRLNMAGYFKGTKARIEAITTVGGIKYYLLYTGSQPQGYVLAEEIQEASVLQNDNPNNDGPGYNANYVNKERTIECTIEDGTVTWDAIVTNLLTYGEFYIDYTEKGENRINIVTELGVESSTTIRDTLNLLEFSESFDASNVVTRVKAIGRPVIEEGSTETKEDIVLDNLVIDEGLEVIFDPKVSRLEFNDVENQNDLKHKVNEFFNDQLSDLLQVDITYMKLKSVGLSFEDIMLGDKIIIDIQDSRYAKGVLRATRIDTDWLQPWKSSVVFGREKPRLTDLFR